MRHKFLYNLGIIKFLRELSFVQLALFVVLCCRCAVCSEYYAVCHKEYLQVNHKVYFCLKLQICQIFLESFSYTQVT